MISKKIILLQTLMLTVIICLIPSRPILASTVQVTVHENLIDIHAENTPLINILKSISIMTGIIIKTGQPLLKTVSCNFKELEIDQAVQRLMEQHNSSHAVLYDKDITGRIVVTEVQIFGEKSTKSVDMNESGNARVVTSPPDDHFKHFERKWFKGIFQDRQKLLKLISATPTGNALGGIQVKSVEKKSIFASLGISRGDTIKAINGSPVWSEDDLLDGLSPPLLPAMLRIEREDKNTMINPIYIKLN